MSMFCRIIYYLPAIRGSPGRWAGHIFSGWPARLDALVFFYSMFQPSGDSSGGGLATFFQAGPRVSTRWFFPPAIQRDSLDGGPAACSGWPACFDALGFFPQPSRGILWMVGQPLVQAGPRVSTRWFFPPAVQRDSLDGGPASCSGWSACVDTLVYF